MSAGEDVKTSQSLTWPRSHFETAVRVGILSGIPFGILFGGPFGWILILVQPEPLGVIFAIALVVLSGALFGVLFGYVMAFWVRSERGTVGFNNRDEFMDRLALVTSKHGYRLESRVDNSLRYKPSFRAGLLSGRLIVQVASDQATIDGPRCYVHMLVGKLRVHLPSSGVEAAPARVPLSMAGPAESPEVIAGSSAPDATKPATSAQRKPSPWGTAVAGGAFGGAIAGLIATQAGGQLRLGAFLVFMLTMLGINGGLQKALATLLFGVVAALVVVLLRK